MSDLETRYHETWLGMVQPVEGLLVSIPVLVDAQCMKRQPPATQQTLLELCPETETKGKDGTAPRRVADLPRFLAELLELTPDLFDAGDALPEPLSLYVPEGRQTIRPTMALRKLSPEEDPSTDTPAAKAGASYEMLVWEIPDALPPDKAETETGPWDYPPGGEVRSPAPPLPRARGAPHEQPRLSRAVDRYDHVPDRMTCPRTALRYNGESGSSISYCGPYLSSALQYGDIVTRRD